MKLFEGNWRTKDAWFERTYDTNIRKSNIYKLTNSDEYYTEGDGPYKALLGGQSLRKHRGYPKKGMKVYSKTDRGSISIRDNYWDPKNSKYNKNPRVWFLDIETTAKSTIDIENTPEEVVLIQIYDSIEKKFIVLGSRDWKSERYKDQAKDEGFDLKDIKYINCKNEINLFKMFFKILRKLNPLLVVGWNTSNFDYPYLFNRATLLGFDSKNFSLIDEPAELGIKKLQNNQLIYKFRGVGLYYMDYMEIYKKFTFDPRASYSLDYICEVELKKNKVPHNYYSTFDGFRTGESYIFPEEEPNDPYDLEMYRLQVQYKENPTPELKEKIHDLANELFVWYGIIDTFRLKELDDKLQLITLMLSISSKMGVTLPDVMGTIRPWASFIEKYVYQEKKILPLDEVSEETMGIKGGLVTDPKTGIHKWVISVDINSAYPNLSMRGFNMSPETYVAPKDLPENLRKIVLKYFNDEDEFKRFNLLNEPVFKEYSGLLKKYNLSGSVTGAIYKKDEIGIIPKLVEEIYAERKEQKSLMLKYKQKSEDTEDPKEKAHFIYLSQQADVMQMALKILINSLYGALTMKYFRLYNPHIGRAITGNTRFYILLLNKNLQKYLESIVPGDYVIYNDTDSAYLTLDPIVSLLQKKEKLSEDEFEITDWIDKFVKKKLDPVIEQTNKEMADIFNAFDYKVIKAEREVIASTGLWISKKKYILNVIDNEGVRYHEPVYKMTGVELKKSSTPKYFQKKLEESINIIMSNNFEKLQDFIDEVRHEITKIPLKDIAKVTSVNNLSYDLDKPKYKDNRKVAIPINSRAALATNKLIQSNEEYKHRFNPIEPGGKVQLLYLVEPNPFKQNIMAFQDPNFAELFKDYVDYSLIFDKFFLDNLKIMISPIDDWMNKIQQDTEELDEW